MLCVMLRDSFEMLPKSLAHCTRFSAYFTVRPAKFKVCLDGQYLLKKNLKQTERKVTNKKSKD